MEECCSRERITLNGAKIKLLCNMRTIHLDDLFSYLFTLTPSVDYADSLSGRSRLVASEYPKAANKYILKNSRKMLEICSQIL